MPDPLDQRHPAAHQVFLVESTTTVVERHHCRIRPRGPVLPLLVRAPRVPFQWGSTSPSYPGTSFTASRETETETLASLETHSRTPCAVVRGAALRHTPCVHDWRSRAWCWCRLPALCSQNSSPGRGGPGACDTGRHGQTRGQDVSRHAQAVCRRCHVPSRHHWRGPSCV